MDNHKQRPWHAQQLTEVYNILQTSEDGLSDAEALERLRKNGRKTAEDGLANAESTDC